LKAVFITARVLTKSFAKQKVEVKPVNM